MTCPHCQTDNREGRRFCAKCGAALALVCPSCGFVNEPGDEFCGGCGKRPAPFAPTSPESRARHTPEHLDEKILISRGALEGERKQVTVLFADLKGSMELREAEALARRLADQRRLGWATMYREMDMRFWLEQVNQPGGELP